jgi:hypothetical protein
MDGAGPSENSEQTYHPTRGKNPQKAITWTTPALKLENIIFVFIAIRQSVSYVQRWRSLCHPSEVHAGFTQHIAMCVNITESIFMQPWISAAEMEQVGYPKQVDVSHYNRGPQTFTLPLPFNKFMSQVTSGFWSYRHFPVIIIIIIFILFRPLYPFI